MLHCSLQKINDVQLSELPWSLKMIGDELWSCQQNSITVFDEELNMLRTFKAHRDNRRVYSVGLLPDSTFAVAGGGHLYQSSKSGMFIFIMFYFVYVWGEMNIVLWIMRSDLIFCISIIFFFIYMISFSLYMAFNWCIEHIFIYNHINVLTKNTL